MPCPRAAAVLLLAAMLLSPASGWGKAPAMRVGQCVTTRIAEVGHRLDGVDDSGAAVSYENGATQVSYEESRVVRAWRAGDTVKLCLVSVPRDCPRGDGRGKVYRVTNLRTHGQWSSADSAHMCGGA